MQGQCWQTRSVTTWSAPRRRILSGRILVRAVTSPVNRGSVAFHQRMGFQLEPGDAQVDGIRFPPAMTAKAATGFASSGACAVPDLLLTPQRPGDSHGGQVIAPRTSIPVQ